MERYEEIKTIGKGSFGRAILVKRKSDDQLLVLKQINVLEMSEKERNDAMNEVHLLSMLDHENIIGYHDSFLVDGCLHIVMEYANAGDIHLEIKNRILNKKHFTEFEILSWFSQICSAIKYISSKNILHRDLKTQNIFLSVVNDRYLIKLGDFGIARILSSETSLAQTVIGTPFYLSPEICEDRPYDHKSDIWSLGCVLYELATLKHAFNAGSLPALVLKILKGTYPPIPSFFSSSLRNLISSMLQTDPKQRPHIDQIIRLDILKPYIGKDLKPFSVDSSPQSSSSSSSISSSPSTSFTKEDDGGFSGQSSSSSSSSSLTRSNSNQQNIPMAIAKSKTSPSMVSQRSLDVISPVKSTKTTTTTTTTTSTSTSATTTTTKSVKIDSTKSSIVSTPIRSIMKKSAAASTRVVRISPTTPSKSIKPTVSSTSSMATKTTTTGTKSILASPRSKIIVDKPTTGVTKKVHSTTTTTTSVSTPSKRNIVNTPSKKPSTPAKPTTSITTTKSVSTPNKVSTPSKPISKSDNSISKPTSTSTTTTSTSSSSSSTSLTSSQTRLSTLSKTPSMSTIVSQPVTSTTPNKQQISRPTTPITSPPLSSSGRSSSLSSFKTTTPSSSSSSSSTGSNSSFVSRTSITSSSNTLSKQNSTTNITRPTTPIKSQPIKPTTTSTTTTSTTTTTPNKPTTARLSVSGPIPTKSNINSTTLMSSLKPTTIISKSPTSTPTKPIATTTTTPPTPVPTTLLTNQPISPKPVCQPKSPRQAIATIHINSSNNNCSTLSNTTTRKKYSLRDDHISTRSKLNSIKKSELRVKNKEIINTMAQTKPRLSMIMKKKQQTNINRVDEASIIKMINNTKKITMSTIDQDEDEQEEDEEEDNNNKQQEEQEEQMDDKRNTESLKNILNNSTNDPNSSILNITSGVSDKRLQTRANALKQFCISVLGGSTFTKSYEVLKELNQENEEEKESQLHNQLQQLVGEKVYYLKYLQQLYYCESKLDKELE